ncbi:hypothetical protein ACKFKG_05710 [Phormidesmis sp. 146-35]
MKASCWTASVVWMLPLLIGSAAQAQSLAGLSSVQLQRLSRDLVPSSSEDFFRKGREQFDRELELLRRPSKSPDRLLKVDSRTQYPQQNDRPKFPKSLDSLNDRLPSR